jgi:hypothetical protein
MTKRLKNVLMGVAAFAALGLGGSAIAGAASGPDQGTGQSPRAEVRDRLRRAEPGMIPGSVRPLVLEGARKAPPAELPTDDP